MKFIRNTNITLLQDNYLLKFIKYYFLIEKFLILSWIVLVLTRQSHYLTVLEYLGMPEGEEVARGVASLITDLLTPILM